MKLAYIISLVHKASILEWTAHELGKHEIKPVFILMHNRETEFERNLKEAGFNVYRVHFANKRQIFSATLQMIRILRKEKIDMVHTHLYHAGLLGLTAAKWCGIKFRIHTRHDATVNHDYYPHAVKYDRYTNRTASHIIAISESVKDILVNMENVPAAKVTVLHHGFHLDYFAKKKPADILTIRGKYQLQDAPFPVVGVISRYMEWKGIQYTIEAFRNLLPDYPGAMLILANAGGPYEQQITELLSTIPKTNIREIRFESDIVSLYSLFNVFVHVPIDGKSEAFGQVYIEAMAAQVPCVVTLSGIAHDYIRNEYNALVVPYTDSLSIEQSIRRILNDKNLSLQLTENALLDIRSFSVEVHTENLVQLYKTLP